MAVVDRVKKRISGALEARGWEINRVPGDRAGSRHRQLNHEFGTVDFSAEWQAVTERTPRPCSRAPES